MLELDKEVFADEHGLMVDHETGFVFGDRVRTDGGNDPYGRIGWRGTVIGMDDDLIVVLWDGSDLRAEQGMDLVRD